MQPDPDELLSVLGITKPLIGFYDVPDIELFQPIVEPKPGKQSCLFSFYPNWIAGETLHITRDNFGCGGAGRALCSIDTRTREELVTFLVAPDQLSALTVGAYYRHGAGEPAPLIAPFGAGCMELLPVFRNLGLPQAAIGATDIAMRQHLPPDILAFTVTVPMFEQFCSLDRDSFLYKPFWKRLVKARE